MTYSGSSFAASPEGGESALLPHDPSHGGGMYGPSICVDPLFDYYKTNDLDRVARAIRSRGFSAVQIIRLTGETPEKEKAFADAFRRAGLTPVLRVYPPTDFALYQSHPEWRQKMLGNDAGKHDWRPYLCPNIPAFVEAYCQRVEDHMRNGGYDGIQIGEIWFEQWGGPFLESGEPRANYACICDACVAKFRSQTGVDAREMLLKKDSPSYVGKPENRELYEKWVTFRVDTIQSFGSAIIEAARRGNLKAVINIMFLSDASVEPGKSREYQANDLDRMVREWKPDIVTLQDAWQDWTVKDLSPDFVATYAKAYRDRIETAHPGTFVMTHADLGSLPVSKRSYDWIRSFSQLTVKHGLGASSGYEWSVSVMAVDEKPPSAP